jgi:hypothetical protein
VLSADVKVSTDGARYEEGARTRMKDRHGANLPKLDPKPYLEFEHRRLRSMRRTKAGVEVHVGQKHAATYLKYGNPPVNNPTRDCKLEDLNKPVWKL